MRVMTSVGVLLATLKIWQSTSHAQHVLAYARVRACLCVCVSVLVPVAIAGGMRGQTGCCC